MKAPARAVSNSTPPSGLRTSVANDRGGDRVEGADRRLHTEQRRALRFSTHDLRIKSTNRDQDYWGPSASNLDNRRPSTVSVVPSVPVILNSLVTILVTV